MPFPRSTYALISGASAGIGQAIARELAQRGHNILLVARTFEPLELEVKHLKEQYAVEVDCCTADLRNAEDLQRLFDWIGDRQYTVDFLVNNAGIGSLGAFSNESVELIDNMVELNIQALVRMCRHFAPKMQEQGSGHILNVASMAAYYPLPFKAVYSASKAFVYQFSECLRLELMEHNVNVTVLCAGPVPTNEEVRERMAKTNKFGQRMALTAERVAREAVAGTLNRKRAIVPGLQTKFGLLLMRIGPGWIRRPVFRKVLRRD